jgi:hypothetical protein
MRELLDQADANADVVISAKRTPIPGVKEKREFVSIVVILRRF